MSSAQILRSQKRKIAPADSLLNRGFEAAISGDVEKALNYYNQIIEDYKDEPAAVKAYLNKGIIQYNSGSFEESISSFEAVLDNVSKKPIVREKAYWYMGNAFINIDELKKAREAIHTTYAIDGIYRKPAFRLLKKLDHELGNVDFDNFEQQMNEG
ncbi:MAG: tetratricopeptide repeat protein [Fodinibius sp.]|nr:tetratricopeptide repeat protein [Fodinibius sp.]